MKLVALFTENKLQLVLTPEDAAEKAVIATLGHDTKMYKMQAHRNSFYATRGGWYAESANTDSLIITVEP